MCRSKRRRSDDDDNDGITRGRSASLMSPSLLGLWPLQMKCDGALSSKEQS